MGSNPTTATNVAGDDEPVPMADRPEATRIAEAPSPPEMLRRYATHARHIHERLGSLAAVLLFGARSGDAELRELTADADSQRLRAARLLASRLEKVDALRPGVTRSRAQDLTWLLNSPEVHWLLTVERGWTENDYEHFLAEALTALLLGGTT